MTAHESPPDVARLDLDIRAIPDRLDTSTIDRLAAASLESAQWREAFCVSEPGLWGIVRAES